MRQSSLISITSFLPVVLVAMVLIEAGVVQFVVLVALLAAEAVAVVLTIELAARGRFTH